MRDRPEARALVDRCLLLLSQAATADAATLIRLDAEVGALRDDLEARFGRAAALKIH